MEILTNEQIDFWFKNRKKQNIYSFGNVRRLTFIFIDIDTSDYLILTVREIRQNPKLLKLYQKTFRKKQITPMFQGWLNAISQNR